MNESLQSRFKSAMRTIYNLNEQLADYYISEYWDDGWMWGEIDENVVCEAEKDAQQQYMLYNS